MKNFTIFVSHNSKREYIPVGYIPATAVAANKCQCGVVGLCLGDVHLKDSPETPQTDLLDRDTSPLEKDLPPPPPKKNWRVTPQKEQCIFVYINLLSVPRGC